MRIFVEGSSLLKQRSGIGQFTKRLLESYAASHPEDTIIITGFKFFTQGSPEYAIKPTDNIQYRVIRWLPGRIYNLFFKFGIAPPMDLLFRARRSDIFLFPNFVRFPLLYNRRSMLMVHDLSFVYYSQFTHPKDLPYKLKYVPSSIKKADRIITISKNSRRQIQDYYHVQTNDISIVYPAVDTSVFKKQSRVKIERVVRKYKLPKKYILYTGTLEPRKNLNRLLDAYELLDERLQKAYGLVLAGGQGWQDADINNGIKRLQDKGFSVTVTGYVDDADLPSLYSGGDVFVFPSLYEGFGIPPLEAMACGVPVVTSNNSSLPEAVGNAAMLINADDTRSIAGAITEILQKPGLRQDLINKGHDQTQKYTWEKSADQLHTAIESLLG